MGYRIRIQNYERGIPLPYDGFMENESVLDYPEDAMICATGAAQMRALILNSTGMLDGEYYAEPDEINYTVSIYFLAHRNTAEPVIVTEYIIEEIPE